jgi:exopolysaccharide production protein ExoQ
MVSLSFEPRPPASLGDIAATPLAWLGALIGIIMPVISGLVYPTYYHKLPNPLMEWTRLLEAPFVICELLVIVFAMHRGMEIQRFIRPLSPDLKVASFLFFAGLWTSSLFVSAVPATSIALSVATTIHILFAFAIFHFVERHKKQDLQVFGALLALGLLVLAFYTAWRFCFPIPASQVPGGIIEWSFAVPGFISVRYLGTSAGAIAAFFAATLIRRGDQARLSWPEFFFTVAMGMTIWSGTRAGIMGIMVACCAMVIIQRRIPSLAVIGRMCILTGIAASLAYLLIPFNDTVFMLIAPDDGYGGANVVTSGRVELWVASLLKWQEAPWLGWGSGSTFWEVYLGWTHTQPHNVFIQFLISWGIVGTTGAVWLLFRATVAAQKITNANQEYWPFMAMLYSLLAMSMVDGALYYPRLIMFAMVCFAVILSGKQQKPTI